MCGRRFFASVALNLELDWDDVLVLPAIDGSDTTLQSDGFVDALVERLEVSEL